MSLAYLTQLTNPTFGNKFYYQITIFQYLIHCEMMQIILFLLLQKKYFQDHYLKNLSTWHIQDLFRINSKIKTFLFNC